MKIKHILLSLTLLIVGGLITSCIDDKSTLDINDIPGVAIDTTGMETLSVYQFDHLVVNPTVNSIGLSDSDLSYEWKINIQANDTNFIVIGEEINLDYEVRLRPNIPNRHYNLVFTVTDNSKELDYIMAWKTTVKNNLGEGLVIAETIDGNMTDLSILMSPEVTEDFESDRILSHVYSANNNGAYLDGIIKQMKFVSIYGINALLAITDNSVYSINTFDYAFRAANDDMFYSSKDEYHPQLLGKVDMGDIYVGNGQLTSTNLGSSRKIGIPFDFPYAIPDHVAMNPIKYPTVVLNFFDEELGGFVYLPSIAFGDKNMHPIPPMSGGAFNPANISNKENVAAATNQNGDFLHLLKDKSTGDLALYVLDGGVSQYPSPIPPSPLGYYDLSTAPDIANASNFVFMDNQKVMYYATSNKIYAVLYGGLTPVIEERYTAPVGEEITTLQVYNQVGHPNSSEYISTNNKQLIMSTYSIEGKVYLLPIVNIGAGNIDEANIKIFGGFGKISAIEPQK